MKTVASLQVLFDTETEMSPEQLQENLGQSDSSLAKAVLESTVLRSDQKSLQYTTVCLAEHRIKVVFVDSALPAEVFKPSVSVGHYPMEIKDRASKHIVHAVLIHEGNPQVLENHFLLCGVTASMADQGCVIMNEASMASAPCSLLSPKNSPGNMLAYVRQIPLPLLITGLTKVIDDSLGGVWMRTNNNFTFGVPNLAIFASTDSAAEEALFVIDDVSRYLIESGAEIAAGHTLDCGGQTWIVRKPVDDEPLVGNVLVLAPSNDV